MGPADKSASHCTTRDSHAYPWCDVKVILCNRNNVYNKTKPVSCSSPGHLKDPRDLPGLAHFCEHMLFLGTEKVMNVAVFYQTIVCHITLNEKCKQNHLCIIYHQWLTS